MRKECWLSWRWIPPEATSKSPVSRRPVETKLCVSALKCLQSCDLMASPVSAHCIQAAALGVGNRLLCSTRYAWDVPWESISFLEWFSRSGIKNARVWLLFPLTALPNSAVQYLPEQQPHAVVELRYGTMGNTQWEPVKAEFRNLRPWRGKRLLC